jgi:hypothetical protein
MHSTAFGTDAMAPDAVFVLDLAEVNALLGGRPSADAECLDEHEGTQKALISAPL